METNQSSGGSRIFPRGVRQLPKVLLFFNCVPQNCMNMKEFGQFGPPLRSANAKQINTKRQVYQFIRTRHNHHTKIMNMRKFRLKKFEVRLFTVMIILDDKKKITNVTWSQVCTKLLCFILISKVFAPIELIILIIWPMFQPPNVNILKILI